MRSINDLTTIAIHHDAWPKATSGRFNDLELAREIARDHVASKKVRPTGDPGFPYDCWIRNGKIYICNDILPIKWAVGNNNDYTVHICVSGDYANYDGLTDTDRNALLAAFAMYKAQMPVYKAIKGHKELNPSQCPGIDMNRLRSDIMALELEIERSQSLDKKQELAYRMENQVLYLQRMAQNGVNSTGKPVSEGERKWALTELMKLEQPFREYGWLD